MDGGRKIWALPTLLKPLRPLKLKGIWTLTALLKLLILLIFARPLPPNRLRPVLVPSSLQAHARYRTEKIG